MPGPDGKGMFKAIGGAVMTGMPPNPASKRQHGSQDAASCKCRNSLKFLAICGEGLASTASFLADTFLEVLTELDKGLPCACHSVAELQ